MTTPTAADLERAAKIMQRGQSDYYKTQELVATALAEARADAEQRAVSAEEANAALRGALEAAANALKLASMGRYRKDCEPRGDVFYLAELEREHSQAVSVAEAAARAALSAPPAGTGSEMPATPEPSMAMERRRAWQRADQLAMQRDALAREVRAGRVNFDASDGGNGGDEWADATSAYMKIRAANEAAGIPGEGETKP